MEIQQLLPQFCYRPDFLQKNFVQILNVLYDVASWFINYVQQAPFVFKN